MVSKRERNSRFLPLLILVIAGETIFFLPFLVARIFRPTMLELFEISNSELGSFFSVYGIVAMVSYLFGGPLADKYPARKLMALALWLTALGGLWISFVPSNQVMQFIYGFWGFTTIFLFWAAMIRATRELGGINFQGRAFGWLEGGRGAVAALLGTASWFIFAGFNAGIQPAAGSPHGFSPLQWVILSISLFTFIAGVLVWWSVPDNREKLAREPAGEMYSKIIRLLRMPTIWTLALIIICAYVGYKITDDFSLYAREILGFSEEGAAATGTGALWLRAVVAVMAGLLGDRFNKVKIIIFLFGLTVVTGLFTRTGIIYEGTGIILLNLTALATGIYGIRALYFSILEEAKIPLGFTGAAVGIVSFMGYTPDVFMSPWMGYYLDKYPVEQGHQYVFLLLTCFALLGFISALIFLKLYRKPGKES